MIHSDHSQKKMKCKLSGIIGMYTDKFVRVKNEDQRLERMFLFFSF